MNKLTVIFHIVFVYVVVVCPINNVASHGKFMGRHHEETEIEHKHSTERPCPSCPHGGSCVPRVQCPALERPASSLPECHLPAGLGVCCPADHSAESRKARAAIPSEELKRAHARSREKLASWLARANQLVEERDVTVRASAPAYGHHLSLNPFDSHAEKLGRGGLQNLFAAEELRARQVVSDDDLAFGFMGQADSPFCPPQPACVPSSRYRSMEGSCNNAAQPTWGAARTGYRRLLSPEYSDGVWAMRLSRSGQPLPSARAVSARLLIDGSHPSATHNLMFMQFGQFLTHDVTAGVVFTIGNGSAISCCSEDGASALPPRMLHWACAPILVEPEDPFFGRFGQRCLSFVRTQLAPSSDCIVGRAQQMNGVSHYIDLSQLYGSSADKLVSLRAPEGRLRVFNDFGRELPPLTDRQECLGDVNGACFDSGDNHGNQIISLTALHTIWTREHNRVARTLSRINSAWNEDRIFMETRRILQAEFQNIVYNEWLPLVLGAEIMQMYRLSPSGGYSSSYDPGVDPSLTAEFSTSAMRFGHSLVDGKIVVPNVKSGDVHETISIPEVMFQPSRLRIRPFLDRLLVGLSWQPMQTVDPFVSESLSHYLFRGAKAFGLDLAAINIQRGREHGVRPYNHYRRLIGLTPFDDFRQFPPSAGQRLASVYSSVEDIDLWVGGLLEEHVEGGIVGPTFAHIIADQFARLKSGDRFFYENGPDVTPGAFSPGQLAEIRKVTFSRIICDNSDGIELTLQPPKAFLRADLPGNEPISCASPLIASMDLNKFKDLL